MKLFPIRQCIESPTVVEPDGDASPLPDTELERRTIIPIKKYSYQPDQPFIVGRDLKRENSSISKTSFPQFPSSACKHLYFLLVLDIPQTIRFKISIRCQRLSTSSDRRNSFPSIFYRRWKKSNFASNSSMFFGRSSVKLSIVTSVALRNAGMVSRNGLCSSCRRGSTLSRCPRW